jgi:hypothetical protein
MSLLVDVFSTGFAVLSIAALAFFVHKVFWLWRYKRIEGHLLGKASERLEEAQRSGEKAWSSSNREWWDELTDNREPGGAAQLAEQRGSRLRSIESAAKVREPTAHELLAKAAQGELEKGSVEHKLLVLPQDPQTTLVGRLKLENVSLDAATAPAEGLFKLDAKSRYGIVRRALVFCAGIADVVYSSQHVSMMSRYTHVPISLIIKRLLLVIILVVGLASQVLFGAREGLQHLLETSFKQPLDSVASTLSMEPESAAAAIAFVIISGGVTLVYFTFYLYLRFRSQRQLGKLDKLREELPQRLEEIRQAAQGQLHEWATDYGRTLDFAADLAVRRVHAICEDQMQRLRERVTAGALRVQAEALSNALLQALPETSGKLHDALSLEKHSTWHFFWPRADEMGAAISQAQYRSAWQDIELTLGELAQARVEPYVAETLWRKLLTYVRGFPAIFAEDAESKLLDAYRVWAKQIWDGAQSDVGELETELSEAMGYLNHEFDTALPLLNARVTACNELMRASSSKLQAEALSAREKARLEAMAFEI